MSSTIIIPLVISVLCFTVLIVTSIWWLVKFFRKRKRDDASERKIRKSIVNIKPKFVKYSSQPNVSTRPFPLQMDSFEIPPSPTSVAEGDISKQKGVSTGERVVERKQSIFRRYSLGSHLNYSKEISETNHKRSRKKSRKELKISSVPEINPKLYVQENNNGSPVLAFSLRSDMYNQFLTVILNKGENFPKLNSGFFMIHISLSSCSIIYRATKFSKSCFTLREEFKFPLTKEKWKSMSQLSLRFNVSIGEKKFTKKAFGFANVDLIPLLNDFGEEGIQDTAEYPATITRSEFLTNTAKPSRLSLKLSFSPSSKKIGLHILKAENLVLTAFDHDIRAVVTMIIRHKISSQNPSCGSYVLMSSSPELNEHFHFDVGNEGIANVALKIELFSRHITQSITNRSHGYIVIGNSTETTRSGKVHWAEMMSSAHPIAKWHDLTDD